MSKLDYGEDGSLEHYLPDQGGRKGDVYKMTAEEKVPAHPDESHRWVSWAEKEEWQMQDLLDSLGAEYIGEKDLSDQPFIKANLPKRSSKPEKPSARR